VYVIFKEMRTRPGGRSYRKPRRRVIFIRCQSPESSGRRKVTVEAWTNSRGNGIPGRNGSRGPATGMVPVTAFGPDISKEAKPQEEKKEDKKEESFLYRPTSSALGI